MIRNGRWERNHGISRRRAIGTATFALSASVIALVVLLAFVAVSAQSGTHTVTDTSTFIGTSTWVTSVISTQPVTQTVTTTAVSTLTFAYLSASGPGYCTAGQAYAPCWGGSEPYVFNCLSAAETEQGCTQEVVGTARPYPSYMISIRYPFSNQTEPSWADCVWSVQGETHGQVFAFCSLVNSTSFIIGEPAGPRQ